jgi:hypothetical protein
MYVDVKLQGAIGQPRSNLKPQGVSDSQGMLLYISIPEPVLFIRLEFISNKVFMKSSKRRGVLVVQLLHAHW